MTADDTNDVLVANGTAPIPLHLLGWKSFQDLAIAVAEECLRRPVQTFLATNDAGRDGAFIGAWDGDNTEAGESTIQCKFTSLPNENLVLSALEDELTKVAALAVKGLAKDYVIITNHPVSGKSELTIKEAFEAVGVGRCRVFGFDWIERQIKKSSRLRMMAPRVYGLADLSEILDNRAYRQAKLILSSMGEDLRRLVMTDAHQQAIKAISDHNLVLLLGAPAAGKSTIGAAIAVGAADIWKARTIRATSPHELQKKIEPGNNQFFWIDDAWGNTQYQRATSEAWNQVFPLMQAAMHKGARFLITSRDYIWNQAKQDLKLHAIPVLAKSQVVINVHDFTTQEKAQILYNHLKLGDQTKEYRSAAKEFLPELAENKNFLPEVARRFGMRFFTGDRLPSKAWAKQFFENPQQFLIETITGLSPECKSAVSLVFQNGGKVRSPVDEDLLNASAKHFGVSPGQVRNELQNLNGSLLLLMSDEEGAFWTYKHPTVGDAFAKYVSESPELVEVYLRGASPSAISQEVLCAGIQLHGAPVIIPNTLHSLLADKISSLPSYEITSFLSYRANRAFAELYLKQHPEILNRLRNFIAPIKEDTDARCAAVLYSFDLLPEENREILARQLKEAALESADDSIFDDYPLSQVVPQEERDALISEIKSEVLDRVEEHVERLKAEWSNSYDPDEHFSAFHDSVRIFANLTGDQLYAAKVMQAVDRHISDAVEDMNEEYEPAPTVSAPAGPSSSKSTVLSNLFRDIDH